jgi:hypothetical protein
MKGNIKELLCPKDPECITARKDRREIRVVAVADSEES